MAFGVLVLAFALFFQLYVTALSYSGKSARSVVAANIAQRQMTKLRGWSAEPSGPGRGFDDWTSNTDITFADEEYPDYQVRLRSADEPLISPSSSLVAGAADLRQFTSTFRKVQITVSWSGDSLELVSYVADPTRQLRNANPVVVGVTAGSTTVARDGTVDFQLQVFDSDGRQIPDVMAKWYVKAITGSGTITGSATGSSAQFVNVSEAMDKTTTYTGGQCRVVARVVYRGQEAWGESDLLELAP